MSCLVLFKKNDVYKEKKREGEKEKHPYENETAIRCLLHTHPTGISLKWACIPTGNQFRNLSLPRRMPNQLSHTGQECIILMCVKWCFSSLLVPLIFENCDPNYPAESLLFMWLQSWLIFLDHADTYHLCYAYCFLLCFSYSMRQTLNFFALPAVRTHCNCFFLMNGLWALNTPNQACSNANCCIDNSSLTVIRFASSFHSEFYFF